MEAAEMIDQNTIQLNMKVKTKNAALHVLAAKLLENGYIFEIEGFIKAIYEREAQGQTGIGNYVAIPHGKSAYVKKIGVAIGISEEEIPWESLDGKGVKGIILFAVGDDQEGAKNHLKLLSLFAKKLGNDEVIEQLLNAGQTEDVVKAFK